MANFWESFLNSGPQQLDDPGDPSMPYGPPLWSTPEQRHAEIRSYDPPFERWLEQQQLARDPRQTNQAAAIQGSSTPIQIDAGAPANGPLERATPSLASFWNPSPRSFDDLTQQVNDNQPPL